MKPSLNSRSILAALLAASAFAASTAPALRATTVTSTWTGSTSTNWSNPANWSPSSAYPNNGNAGVSDYNAVINSTTNPNFNPTLDVAATIDALTLNTNASLAMNSGISLSLATTSFTNSGTLNILGNGSFGSATLSLASSGTTLLSGGGTILLTSSSFSRISGGNLTNVDNTIQGAGTISSPITNQSTIRADTGLLTLNANVDNSTGLLDITATGTLSVGATITGGTLSAVSGAQLSGSGTLLNTTLTAPSLLNIPAGSSSPIFAGSLTNHGTISILGNGTFGSATLTFAGSATTTLNGGGTVILSNSSFSRIIGNITNVDNTIRGAGTIASAIFNQATLRAEGGTLTLNGAIDNSAGTTIVAATGTLYIGSTFTGGTLTAQTGSQILGSGTLQNVTLSPGSDWSIQAAASSPTLSGNFTNQANITILGNGTFGSATLSLSSVGATFLNGGGTVTLTSSTFSRISTGTLVNVNNTIQGQGTISSNLTNQSTVLASGGNLTLNSPVDNSAGALNVAANGTLIDNAPITGGSMALAAGAQIGGSSSITSATLSGTADLVGTNTFNNITLAALGQLSIQAADSATFSGTFTNHGTVAILGNGTFGAATLSLPASGTTTLAGGGTILLASSSFSRISSGNLTNADNIIRGAGSITANITNQATILAENGNLTLNGPIDNSAGTLIASSNGTLIINALVNAGTLTAQAGSQVVGSGTLQNITLDPSSSWTIQSAASSPTITGTFTNHGNITLLGNGTFGAATLAFPTPATTTLAGGGTITLTNLSFSRITGGNLTNLDNTIQGSGTISPTLLNQGSIIANAGNLTFNNPVSGTGTAATTPSGSLNVGDFSQPSLANDGNFTMTGNGTLNTISGAGALTLNSAHLVIPSNSPTAHQSDLTATGLNALDLTNNKFIIDPTATRSAILAKLQNETAAGNIFSSTRPANFGIAVLDNAILNKPTFGGTSVSANSILISQELLGDANADGHVDLTDLSSILNHFGQSTPNWTSGNFDHATNIDLTDLSDVLNNFGLTNPNASTSGLQITDYGLPTSVPEPASLMALGAAAMLMIRRRR